MKLTRLFVTLATTVFISSPSFSEELTFGLGAGVDDGLKIYLPINIEQLLIEPTLFIASRNNETKDDVSESKDNVDVIELGVGVFKNEQTILNTHIYYGSRLGYIEVKRKEAFLNSTSSSKQKGYFIAPTIGIEYFLTNKFSVGLDVAFTYSRVDGKEADAFGSFTVTSDTKSTEYNTLTEIIVRYRF